MGFVRYPQIADLCGIRSGLCSLGLQRQVSLVFLFQIIYNFIFVDKISILYKKNRQSKKKNQIYNYVSVTRAFHKDLLGDTWIFFIQAFSYPFWEVLRKSVIHIFYQGEKKLFSNKFQTVLDLRKWKYLLIFGIKEIQLSKRASKSVTVEQLFHLFISCLDFTEI